ncbi:oxidoreductase [Novosphingobium colocasiae]|uniref:Oxidoreductase n=2 Tax=Novosphingobium colocasiae TaxID=1256513 RepID=A0A918PNA8_9SPHN|nr:oxidoreductase [Novosphingobium colocasiae]
MIATRGEDGRIARLRGDPEHGHSRGYACAKGLNFIAGMDSPRRLLQPLKRMPDGSFTPIDLETALDEIAERLGAIREAHGPKAIGLFSGTPPNFNGVLMQLMPDWMKALGSPFKYSTATIDQSSHWVTASRMGYWDAGKHRFEDSEVILLLGCNPLVSMAAYYVLTSNPAKRLKAARAGGLKLIVIDPRRSETARHADCFLQPIPGQDVALLAGMINMILARGWHDAGFCETYVDGLDALRQTLAPFTPEYVAERCGITAQDLETAAKMFSHARRGFAHTGTGGSMGPFSNLVDHLIEVLNAICGRFRRAGESVPNPGVLSAPRTIRAQVRPAVRPWESEPRNRTGYGLIMGEFPSGAMADDILLPGEDRVRALIVDGGNPAVCIPDQAKAVRALKSLELLVCIEPFMTATASCADYILPPKLMYERIDILFSPGGEAVHAATPFGQYLPAVVEPPAGSQVIDDWYFYWAMAKRLGLQFEFAGVPLDMDTPPTPDDLLAIYLRNARIPFDELKRYPGGKTFEFEDVIVQPAEEGADHRLQLAPDDVLEELRAFQATTADLPAPFTHRQVVRRERGVVNSQTDLSDGRGSGQTPAYLHPADLTALGVAPGDLVDIDSGKHVVQAVTVADETVRQGTVSITHCRGGLPDEPGAASRLEFATSLFVRTDQNVEAVNAMPMMTSIPVRVTRSDAVKTTANASQELTEETAPGA